MTQTKQPFNCARLISWLTALLVFLLAAGGFTLSYFSLWDLALAHGLPASRAWIWPLLVDFALVVFSLAVVRASLNGERVWWPWLMVTLFTVATVAFNIIHAQADLLDRVIAVVPPLALFLSFESLMGMVKTGVKRPTDDLTQRPKGAKTQGVKVQKVQKPVGQVTQPEAHKAEPLTERQGQILALLGEGFKQAQIAETLKVGRSTVKRDIKALNGRVKV